MAQQQASEFSRAFAPRLVRRHLIVAVVVGTVLNLINQGDAMMAGDGLNLFKIALTYCVPFCVATYGSYSALCSMAPKTESAR